MDSAKRIMNGTNGELWLDGEYVAEVYKFQAKVSFTKESVKLCGKMMEDSKMTGAKGTGSVGLYKVSSRLPKLLAAKFKARQEPRFTIISKLDDPDAYGAERISVTGVSFDDLTLADWEAGVNGKVESPFTFTDFEYLDMVEE